MFLRKLTELSQFLFSEGNFPKIAKMKFRTCYCWVNSGHIKVWFFVNILILIVEKEFTMKKVGYRRSWGGDFWPATSFKGLQGGYPRKKFQFFFQKSKVNI